MGVAAELSFGTYVDAESLEDSGVEFQHLDVDPFGFPFVPDIYAGNVFPFFNPAEWNKADNIASKRDKGEPKEVLERDFRVTTKNLWGQDVDLS